MTFVKDKCRLIIIILFLITLSVFLTINTSPLYYWFAIYHFHLNEISNISSASLMKCYFFMLRYIQIPWDLHLNLGPFKYSIKGLIHFRDVRHLVLINNLFLIILGVCSIHFINQSHRHNLLWRLINPLEEFLMGSVILVMMAMVNFQEFFIHFHQVLFRNRDWVFNVRVDPVIQVLPTSFFAWCFLAFLGILMIILALLIHDLK